MMTPTQLGGNRRNDYSRHYHRKLPSTGKIPSKGRKTLEREMKARRKKRIKAAAVFLTVTSAGFIIATLISVGF